MTYTDKQIRAFLREVKLEAWAESTPHIRGVGKLLEALREPTEAMVEEGEYNPDCIRSSRGGIEHDIRRVWTAMLDARMGEG